MSSARDIIEAEDPKSIFRQITAIPRYTVQPVAGHGDVVDFFLEGNVWLGRARFFSNTLQYPQHKYWQVIWMPEHPGHTQPERFKNADEAAQWMFHHRKLTRESEDPKSVFQKFSRHPQDLLTQYGFELSTDDKPRRTQAWIKAEDDGWWWVFLSYYKRDPINKEAPPTTAGHLEWQIELRSWDNDQALRQFYGSGVENLVRELRSLALVGVLRESEDPKSVFRQAVSVPKPPPAILNKAIADKEEYLGKGCEWTAVTTNPKGETFCYGGFARGTSTVVATLLFYDRSVRQWVPIDKGTFAEAEDPKSVLRQAKTLPGYHALKRAGFELTANHRLTQTWIRPARELGTWFAIVERSEAGEVFWNIRLVRDDNSIRGDWYDGSGIDQLVSKLRYLCLLSEAEDPKGFLQKLSSDPVEQIRDTLRRASFSQEEASPRYERWARQVQPGCSGKVAEMVRYEWVGNTVWEYTVYSSHGTVAWHTSKMPADQALKFIKRHYFHPKTGQPYA